MSQLPILCLDFDGVIHSYTSGWTAADDVADDVVPGALDFIIRATEFFRVAIYSSRSDQAGGIDAMKVAIHKWLVEGDFLSAEAAGFLVDFTLEWPTAKPPAFVTIDDRAIQFKGVWPELGELRQFKPWKVGNG